MSNLKGNVAIITGSSSGIGAATSKLFAQKGCSVSLTGRNEEGFVGELTDEAFLKRLVDGTVEKFGKLDILINNAGIAISGSVQNAPIADFDKIFSVNVRSVITLTQLCIPHLIKTKGTIVNNSSIAALRPMSYVGYYAMSKAALDVFMKCLALDLAPHGIRVNSVNPGFIETPIHGRDGRGDDAQVDAKKEYFTAAAPLKRSGKPEEIAEAFFYLASGNSSFITGQTLVVDGGFTIAPPR